MTAVVNNPSRVTREARAIADQVMPLAADVPVSIASRSGSIDALARSFVAAQIRLQPVAKNASNPHFESSFADLASILDAALPILNDCGLALAQFPSNDGNGRLVLRSYLMHESGQYISDEMVLSPAKNDPQGQGSALTYARRYAACAILGIRTHDDDGNAGTVTQEPSRRPSQRAKATAKAGTKQAAPPEQAEEDDPEAWFRANGWDGRADHDAWLNDRREKVRAADEDARTAAREWSQANGFSFAKAVPRDLATRFDGWWESWGRTDAAESASEPATAPPSDESVSLTAKALKIGEDAARAFLGASEADREATTRQVADLDDKGVDFELHALSADVTGGADKRRARLVALLVAEEQEPAQTEALFQGQPFERDL